MPEQSLGPEDPPRIGPYEVLSRLGRGGMATVYLGRRESGREVAVKLIRRDLAADEGFRQRFEREVAYARRVRQAYIAPVLDSGDHQGRPFLVTEYIEGPTLEEAVRERGPMAAHEVEQLGELVASALAAIHAVQLVHRDLKPSNVILGRTGPRVIDFGIARALDDSGGLTSQNVRLGTPSYMAPEQFDPDLEVGRPADVFAWGGLLVFASTGQSPFGAASNRKEVDVLAHFIAAREPRLDALEEPLRTLVRAAMAKDPDRRPTARDLVGRLSTGGQLTSAGAAPSTAEPAATAPVSAAALITPTPRGPVPGPPPIGRFGIDGGWPDRNEADGVGVILPPWTGLLVRAGVALGVVLVLLLGWLLLPEAARLLLGVALGGAVVLAVVGAGIWRYRREWWWLPAGGLVLLLAVLALLYVQLTSRLWVSFDKDGRVAVLQGAGPHGVLGAENIKRVEPFGANRQQLPTLLAGALEDGIAVGDRATGEQLARCLPLVFTPMPGSRAAGALEPCADAIAGTPLWLPARHYPIPGTTEHTPAVAATDEQVLLAWTDGNNRRLQAGRSRNGTDVEPLGPLGEGFQSDQEPALATDGARFFLAWRDQDGHLALASSTDGERFGEPVVLDTTTSKTAPALAYGNGMLLLAWVDDGNQLHLWPAADADSLQFVPEQELPPIMERSQAAPNLLFAGENWYLTWAGTDDQVNIQTYTSDLRPLDKDTLQPYDAPSTQYRPAIALLDVFILAWTRPDGMVGLLIAKSSEPDFVNQLALEVRSDAGVNMTTFQGHVLLTSSGGEQQPVGYVLRLP